MAHKRPEHTGPPDLFYNEQEARKYTLNSHIIGVQVQLAERALELLALPNGRPSILLDLGCGSGLSGDALTNAGHSWVGIDISSSMLDVATEREVDGDLILGDMGQGVPFRPGTFDGCISISALQWLCNADTKSQNPTKRLQRFFVSLYSVLCRGSRAVFQFYPENPAQIELITFQAMKAGFHGGVVVDYPNSTKAKKLFLVLFTGGQQALPKGLDEVSQNAQVPYSDRRVGVKQMRGKALMKSKEWIKEKKERARRQGKDVRSDTKYTGRKRKAYF